MIPEKSISLWSGSVKLNCLANGGVAKFVIRGMKFYEGHHQIIHEWWGGYTRHNELRRRVFDCYDNLLDDESIAENHAIMMYEPLLAESKGLFEEG